MEQREPDPARGAKYRTLEYDSPHARTGGHYSLEVAEGQNKIVISDILMGEVWLASGQSNMELSGDTERGWIDELRKSGKPGPFDPDKLAIYLDKTSANATAYPQIRFFSGLQSISDSPQDYVPGNGRFALLRA